VLVALVPVVGVASVAGVAVTFGASGLAALIGADRPDQVEAMLRIMAVFLPVAAAHDLLLAATRGHGVMRPTVLIEKILRQTVQVGGVLVVAQVFGADGAALALAWALPYLPGMVLAGLWYRRLVGRAAATPSASRHEEVPLRQLAVDFWRYTSARSVAQIAQTVLQRADIVMLAALSSPRDAAIYTAATRFVVLGQLATQAVQQVMQPMVARLLAVGDRAAVQRVFSVCTAWTVMLTWPVHITVAASAPLYLAIFGQDYVDDGQATTLILASTMLVATACGAVDVMLLMAGRSGLSLANNVAALVVNLGLNALLIPQWGATGAAVAWAAALVTRNLLPLWQVHALLDLRPGGAGLARVAAAALLCFGVIPLGVQQIPGWGPVRFAATLVVALALYLGLLWTWRHRLALTAFRGLLPGRSPDARSITQENSSSRRRAHAHGS
jgi:O-antigen/teichoic acid export membrane protein